MAKASYVSYTKFIYGCKSCETYGDEQRRSDQIQVLKFSILA